MKFRYARTRRGFPAIEVGGGRSGGKIFGTWVVGKKGALKTALGKTNMVALMKGDMIFHAELDSIPERIFPLYTQTVRDFQKGWVQGPETQGWYSIALIPFRVMNGLYGPKDRENAKLFAEENPQTILKYTATEKSYKERMER